MYGAPFGLDRETALHLGTAFGSGMGRRGEVCGAITGALMAIGMRHGRLEVADGQPREEAFRLANALMDRMAAKQGGVRCRDLLGVDLTTPEGYQQARETNLFNMACPAFIREVGETLEELLDLPPEG